MSPDSRKVLWDATEDAQRILRIAVGKTFADYSHDEWLRAAIERHFIILGEALFRLRQSDAEPANQLTELPRTLALRDQGQDCQPHEIVLTVADHLSILTCELTGQAYNKSAHRRQLMQGLPGRTAGAVEFEHANISAVMLPLGFPYIKGYQPRANFQRAALLHAVSEQVAQHLVLDEAALSAEQRPVAAVELADFSRVKTKAPKREQVAREAPPPAYLRPVIQRDYLARETLSRLLGLAGEEFALRFERWRLIQLGAGQPAERVAHVSASEGDGLGYDIRSFETDGQQRFIEVKTTSFGERTPFFVSANEPRFAKDHASRFRLYRLFDFRVAPRLFELDGPIDRHCMLDATTYRATFAA